MSIPRTTSAPPASSLPGKPHWGFTETGSFFRSEIPIENSTTRLALFLVRETRQDFLSPQDVQFMALKEHSKAFRPETLEQWSHLGRFWMWPTAVSRTSLEQFVKSLGGKSPWLTDEYLWTKMCDDAERRYGHQSRLLLPDEIADVSNALFARTPEMPRSSDSV
jgi:hypothetical protein